MFKERLPRKIIERTAQTAVLLAALNGCGGQAAPAPAPDYGQPTPILTPTPFETFGQATTATPEPTLEPTPSPTPSPEPTPTPVPTADPKIRCDQRLVPEAQTVPQANKEHSKKFTLHVPILEYHLIDTFKSRSSKITNTDNVAAMSHLVVPPKTFNAQMKALHDNGWRTITLGQLAQDLDKGQRPPKKTFVITFDDGYADGYINALPILQKYGFTATFFVIPGRISHQIDAYPVADHHPPTPYLTDLELRRLVAAGMDIGNHSEDHATLTRLKNGKLYYEIDEGAKRIAEMSGVWPESFAYPKGAENSGVIKAVSGCQPMRIAVIQNEFYVALNWNNRFTAYRIKISSGVSGQKIINLATQFASMK